MDVLSVATDGAWPVAILGGMELATGGLFTNEPVVTVPKFRPPFRFRTDAAATGATVAQPTSTRPFQKKEYDVGTGATIL